MWSTHLTARHNGQAHTRSGCAWDHIICTEYNLLRSGCHGTKLRCHSVEGITASVRLRSIWLAGRRSSTNVATYRRDCSSLVCARWSRGAIWLRFRIFARLRGVKWVGNYLLSLRWWWVANGKEDMNDVTTKVEVERWPLNVPFRTHLHLCCTGRCLDRVLTDPLQEFDLDYPARIREAWFISLVIFCSLALINIRWSCRDGWQDPRTRGRPNGWQRRRQWRTLG